VDSQEATPENAFTLALRHRSTRVELARLNVAHSSPLFLKFRVSQAL
jgi:hypothetical protein